VILEAKFVLAPLLALGVLFAPVLAGLPDGLRIALDVAALAILFAGFLVLGKLRAQTSAAEGSAKAWHEERDAMAAKVDRLLEDLIAGREETASLRTLNVELQSRPTLDGLVAQMEALRLAVHELAVRMPGT
jgi:prepilin signal peptidase PulO-like enzyme (type II secretory pathway)